MTRAAIRLVFLAVTVASTTACSAAEMRPGQSCGSCHGSTADNPPRGRATAFGAAGTVYGDPSSDADDGVSGATVDITDATDASVSLQTNDVGNFYTTAKLIPPLQIRVTRGTARAVMADAGAGDCNGCHAPGAQRPGRIHVR